MKNLKRNLEYIEILTDYDRTYRIYDKDIIEMCGDIKKICINDPFELEGEVFNILDNFLLVINDIDSFLDLESNYPFNVKKEGICQIDFIDKNENLLNTFANRDDKTGEQLIIANKDGKIFITINDNYEVI